MYFLNYFNKTFSYFELNQINLAYVEELSILS